METVKESRRYTISKQKVRSTIRASLGWQLGRGHVVEKVSGTSERFVLTDNYLGISTVSTRAKSHLENICIDLNRYDWIRQQGLGWFMKELTVRLHESVGKRISTSDIDLIRLRTSEVLNDFFREAMNHGK